MFKGAQIVFLLQYATVMLVIFCILIVVDHKKTAIKAAHVAPEYVEISEEKRTFKPELLKTELVINQLFEAGALNSEKLESIVGFLGNHNIDLIVELNGHTQPVARSYAVSEALRQLGLKDDSFTIKLAATSSLQVDDAKVRLSWSQL